MASVALALSNEHPHHYDAETELLDSKVELLDVGAHPSDLVLGHHLRHRGQHEADLEAEPKVWYGTAARRAFFETDFEVWVLAVVPEGADHGAIAVDGDGVAEEVEFVAVRGEQHVVDELDVAS